MPFVKPYAKFPDTPVGNVCGSICYVLDWLRLIVFSAIIVAVMVYAAYWIFAHPAHV